MLTRLKHQLSDGKAELARLDSELKSARKVKRAQERYMEIVTAQKQALTTVCATTRLSKRRKLILGGKNIGMFWSAASCCWVLCLSLASS